MDEKFVMEFLRGCMAEFYKITEYEPLSVNVCITDDLYEKRLELAYDESDRQNVKNIKEFIKDLNGTIAFGKKVNDSHTIIISNEMLKSENFNIVSTFIHELTHIHDYMNFANERNCVYTKDIEYIKEFRGFYFWTEFHARRNGYNFYRELFLKANNTIDDLELQINHINNIELPLHLNRLLKNNTDEANIQMYYVVQFLGRYSVWMDLFPEYFKEIPPELYNVYGDKIINLYKFLYNHKNFLDANDKFEELYDLTMDCTIK